MSFVVYNKVSIFNGQPVAKLVPF